MVPFGPIIIFFYGGPCEAERLTLYVADILLNGASIQKKISF